MRSWRAAALAMLSLEADDCWAAWRRGKDSPGGRPEYAGLSLRDDCQAPSGSCLIRLSSLGEIFGLHTAGVLLAVVLSSPSPSSASARVRETTCKQSGVSKLSPHHSSTIKVLPVLPPPEGREFPAPATRRRPPQPARIVSLLHL